MINDFEQRLAFVLGSRLTGALAGKVFVPPAPAEGPDPSLVVGVSAFRPLEPAFLSRKPEVVPGSPDPRRILRLDCDVSVEARAGQNKGRDSKVRALDAALFELGADDFQSGAALTDATDRGFFIQQMQFLRGNIASGSNCARRFPGWHYLAGARVLLADRTGWSDGDGNRAH